MYIGYVYFSNLCTLSISLRMRDGAIESTSRSEVILQYAILFLEVHNFSLTNIEPRLLYIVNIILDS